jgi:hypothetical protein
LAADDNQASVINLLKSEFNKLCFKITNT